MDNTVILEERSGAYEKESKQDSPCGDPLKVEPTEKRATTSVVDNEHVISLLDPNTYAKAEKNAASLREDVVKVNSSKTCIVPGCNLSADRGYKFPKVGANRKLWLKACSLTSNLLPKDPYICSNHFTPEQLRLTPRGKTTLVKGAVPVLNLPNVEESLKKRPRRVKKRTYITSKSLREAKSVTSTWECNLCKFSTNKKSIILQHYKTSHINVEHFKCSVCPYSSKRPAGLHHHYKTSHSTMKDFKCDLCEYSTKSKSSLQFHLNAVHLKIKEYKCNQCSKEFTQRTHMNTHKRFYHDGIKDYKCDKCDYGCSARNKLHQHKREVHDKIKPYACDECEYSSTRQSNLKKHKMIVHLKLPTFKCKECDLKFEKRRDMQEHLKAIHKKEVSKYKCDLCDYFTVEGKNKVERHKRAVHYQIKEHICECGVASARRSNLLRHKMEAHFKVENSTGTFHCTTFLCNFNTTSREEYVSHMTGVHARKIEPGTKKDHRERKWIPSVDPDTDITDVKIPPEENEVTKGLATKELINKDVICGENSKEHVNPKANGINEECLNGGLVVTSRDIMAIHKVPSLQMASPELNKQVTEEKQLPSSEKNLTEKRSEVNSKPLVKECRSNNGNRKGVGWSMSLQKVLDVKEKPNTNNTMTTMKQIDLLQGGMTDKIRSVVTWLDQLKRR